MKNALDLMKNGIIKAAKVCYDSPANFWQTAAILTISAYHICQIAIVAINKDTPKKEKAFLIPQEITDGVLDLATFAVFAQGFKMLGRRFVNKEIIKPFKRDKNVFAKEFATTTNLVGSLLAINVVAPVIRNKVGADMQKVFMKKDSTQKNYPSNMAINKFSNGLKI